MTRTVDIAEAQDHLEELVCSVLNGIEIVIAKNREPIARLVAVAPRAIKRTPGLGKGDAWIAGDFDAPLPDDFWTGAG